MASSGWQGQKNVQTSKYPHMALNLRIDSISHTGTTLTYTGVVRVVCTSGHISWNPASVSLTGGGSKSVNLNLSTGGHADTGTFSCTISNVSASTTTYTVTASLNAGSVASGSTSWTLQFGSGGNPPSGGYITYNSCTWDSINATSGVSSWGSTPGNIHAAVITGETNGDADSYTSFGHARREFFYNGTSSTSHVFNATDSSTSATYDGTPLSIKGLLHYKLGYYNYNSIGNTSGIDSTLRYLPPAPGQFSYTEQGASTKTYTVNYVGSTTNNHSTYDAAELTRTVRYKVGSDQWTYVTQAVTATDAVTTFTVVVPAGQMTTVEAWETYHGMGGETQTITLVNTDSPVNLYGSVNGETKLLGPIYGSVNGRAKKLTKIYASVGGVTKKVYEDV